MVILPENILLIGAVLLFFSVIAGKAGYRFGVPVLLLFLGVGMLFGSDGFGIQFNSSATAQFIGVVSLSVILFSGGMDTKISSIRPVLGQGIALSTFGVLATALVTGGFIYFISSVFPEQPALTLAESMLLAVIMSSTDSASVFSILRTKKQGLKENLQPTLELESGSNDPMAYMLTVLLIGIVQSAGISLWDAVIMFFVQMTIGALAGWLFGRVTLFLINRMNVDNQSLYSVLLLASVFFIFSFTDLLKGNGYLAVYIAGVVVGNKKMVHKRSLTSFFDGLAWLFQIVMFLSLGLLVNPSELIPVAGIGLLIGVFMIFVSRPVAVFLSLAPFRKITLKARVFISWVGLRGAVPIIFATYPMIAGVKHASFIFNIVFFITIVSLLIQGTTVNRMAAWLGLAKKGERKDEFGIEFPEEIKAAMSEIEVTESLLSNGDRLMDLPLPDNTLVVMIKRDGIFFIPKGKTRLHEKDKLLVISDNDEELKKTYSELGVEDFYIKKNQ